MKVGRTVSRELLENSGAVAVNLGLKRLERTQERGNWVRASQVEEMV